MAAMDRQIALDNKIDFFMVSKIKGPFFGVTCGAEHEYGIRKGILDQILVIQ